MAQKRNVPKPSRGPLRWLLRLPIILYRARLGWLLGNRFLMLTHIGRKSGLPHDTVLEVVDRDEAGKTYYVAAGWGEESDWYRNIVKAPSVLIHVGRRRLEAVAERLLPDAAEAVLRSYGRRHPFALRSLARGLSLPFDGSEDGYRTLARELPIVALRSPKRSSVEIDRPNLEAR